MAATCTHPLDLLKVILQTPPVTGAKPAPPKSLVATTVDIVKRQGPLALYNGLSASWLRQVGDGRVRLVVNRQHLQVTYSTTRFGIYEVVKQQLTAGNTGGNIPFYQKVLLAGVSGAAGGFVGTPGDMINVRMQNDIKLPIEQRRNYKHALDGLYQVWKHEGDLRFTNGLLTDCRCAGTKCLFNGASTATTRAVLVTIGQIAMYDQYKQMLLSGLPQWFDDNLVTHFTASSLAGATATTMTQPLDVMKTRMMNARPGEYKSIAHCARIIYLDHGPIGFFKGYVPAFVRLAPHTILMFVFFEQLRMYFGKRPA